MNATTHNGCTFSTVGRDAHFTVIKITPINGVFMGGHEEYTKVPTHEISRLDEWVKDNY